MRKLMTLVVMALAGMAFMASPAAAENPDFPHGDFDQYNWEAVEIVCATSAQCSFESEGAEWTWSAPGMTSFSCQLDDFDGETLEPIAYNTGLMAATSVAVSGSDTRCATMNSNINRPSTAAVCYHVPTGEFWVRQRSFDAYTWNATYGQVQQTDDDQLTLSFGDGGSGTDAGFNTTVTHQLDNPLRFDEDISLYTWGQHCTSWPVEGWQW